MFFAPRIDMKRSKQTIKQKGKIFNSEEKKGGDNETNEKRNYDKAYVELGFTVTTVRDEERPLCRLCQKMFIV